MPFLDALSLDQLNRVLGASRWVLGILAFFVAIAGIFNLWLSDRISHLQSTEKIKAQERLRQTETELQEAKSRTAQVATELARYTVPRQLTSEQLALLRPCLASGPKGKVLVTFLSVETDAEQYSRQIASLLSEAGFEVSVSPHLWLQLAYGGIFLGARDTQYSGSHALHIQQCFNAAGVKLKAAVVPDMLDQLGVDSEAIVFAVSNRE